MSAAVMPAGVAQELERICGAGHVQADPQALAPLAVDEVTPQAAVEPGSAEEVAAILRLAGERGWVVAPAGAGTGGGGGIPERIDVLLRSSRLNQIQFYDPGDLTLGAGAGLTAAQLSAALAEHAQFLPLDGPQPARATVGGILAANRHGPLRHGYGGVREFCIGIQFVTGDGKIAKGGGRVVKNVTGYDMMKLVIGSYGTLAFITAANFKVFPRPRQTSTFVMEFAALPEALSFRERMARSPLTPFRLELVNARALEYLGAQPEPRDPDHFAPQQPVATGDERWRIALSAAGSDAVLARYRQELGSAVTRELNGGEEAEFWRAISDFVPRVAARHRNLMVVNLSLAPAAAPAALAAVERAGLENNLLPALVGRIGVGALVAAFIPLAVDPPSAMQYGTAVSALRAGLPPDSAAVVERCPTEAKRHFDLWGSTPTHPGSMRAIKRALDPQNILNRGRFLV